MPTQEDLDKTLKVIWTSMDKWDLLSAVNLLCDVIVNMCIKSNLPRDKVLTAVNKLITDHPHWPDNQPKDKQ